MEPDLVPAQVPRRTGSRSWRLCAGILVLVACTNPANVEPEPTYVDVVAGDFHTCGLSLHGDTYCWGYNAGTFLGNRRLAMAGTPPQSSTDLAVTTGEPDWTRPRLVDGDPGFSTIAAGSGFSCGLAGSGEVYCWGRNERGKLGDGTVGGERFRAEPVAGNLKFAALAALAASGHACAIGENGTAYCWGNNWRRQLGAGPEADTLGVPEPTPVAGNHAFAMLAAGPGESCGIALTAELYCWGADGAGLRDSDRDSDRDAPVLTPTSIELDTVGVGFALMCSLVQGSAYCRGWNANGALGTGDTVSHAVFVPVSTDLVFETISVGNVHVCAVTGSGTAYCWGAGASGQLGNGTLASKLTPTAVVGGHVFRKISAGGHHTCGLTVAGEVYCWGSGFYGQLGTGNKQDSAIPVPIAPPIA